MSQSRVKETTSSHTVFRMFLRKFAMDISIAKKVRALSTSFLDHESHCNLQAASKDTAISNQRPSNYNNTMTMRFRFQCQIVFLLLFLQFTQVVSRLRALQDEEDAVNEYTAFPTLAPTVMVFNVTDHSRTPKEKARDYGFLLLWGVFFLAVFVLATYVVNHFMDRCCCCCVFEPEAMDQGMVSRKAQLFGLTLNERAKLLERIFPASVCWQADESLPVTTPVEISEDPFTDVQHDRVCCICLLPYESRVHILKGTTCQHTFHYSCCMEWLKKHDECPYCRRELFTASELRSAAKEVLGQSRVRAMGFPHMDPGSVLNASTNVVSQVDVAGDESIPAGVNGTAPVVSDDSTQSSDVESIFVGDESIPTNSQLQI